MYKKPDLLKGLLAGIAGGLLASLIMEQFQALWSKAANALPDQPKEKGKPATVKAADAIAQKFAGHNVPAARQEMAGEAVHYTMGLVSGAAYGLASELVPFATLGQGTGFGAAVFLLADEVSVPALGLSKPASETAMATHLYGFASHLVYGWTAELVRAAVRKALS
jgi:putative membrane protein